MTAGDPRYLPLVNTAGGSWAGRPYFRDARHDPGRVKVSRPYRSSTGRSMCVTLSVADEFRQSGVHAVFCCDLLWWDAEDLRPEPGSK